MESRLDRIAAAVKESVHGNYDAAAQIFELTKEGEHPEEIVALAESVGLMSVKLEAGDEGLRRALEDVQRQNVELRKAARVRAELGLALSCTIILLSVYVLTVAFVHSTLKLDAGPLAPATHVVNLGLFLGLAFCMVLFLRNYDHSLAEFGLTLAGWRRSLAESVAACLPAFAGLVALKWLLVQYHPAFAGKPLVDWSHWGPWQMFLIYVVGASAQELMIRGFMQGCIEQLLTSRRRRQIAILLASVQFGVVHLHYSFGLGMLAIGGGLLFGTLYARHRTIVGATAAHYILGQLVFGPLGLV